MDTIPFSDMMYSFSCSSVAHEYSLLHWNPKRSQPSFSSTWSYFIFSYFFIHPLFRDLTFYFSLTWLFSSKFSFYTFSQGSEITKSECEITEFFFFFFFFFFFCFWVTRFSLFFSRMRTPNRVHAKDWLYKVDFYLSDPNTRPYAYELVSMESGFTVNALHVAASRRGWKASVNPPKLAVSAEYEEALVIACVIHAR